MQTGVFRRSGWREIVVVTSIAWPRPDRSASTSCRRATRALGFARRQDGPVRDAIGGIGYEPRVADDSHPLPLLPSPIGIRAATVLEADSAAHLLRLVRDPKIARHLLARIGDRKALVDRGAEAALATALRTGGHRVKVVRGEP